MLTVQDCPVLHTGEDGPTETSPATTPFIPDEIVVTVETTVDVIVDVSLEVAEVEFDTTLVVAVVEVVVVAV